MEGHVIFLQGCVSFLLYGKETQLYLYILFHVFSVLAYHRIFGTVPCAMQQDLVYPSCM